MTMSTIELAVENADGSVQAAEVDLTEVFNFGYAGRDEAGVLRHIEELRHLGLPAPEVVPAIFPLPADRVSQWAELQVPGDETYGEVEFALTFDKQGTLLVTIASDHSDLSLEADSTPKAKAMCPDVIGRKWWRYEDVSDHWDDLVLKCSRTARGETTVVQEGGVSELLDPVALLKVLESRLDKSVGPGTLVLSGTIAGEPVAGGDCWSVHLADPVLGRAIEVVYEVKALPGELIG